MSYPLQQATLKELAMKSTKVEDAPFQQKFRQIRDTFVRKRPETQENDRDVEKHDVEKSLVENSGFENPVHGKSAGEKCDGEKSGGEKSGGEKIGGEEAAHEKPKHAHREHKLFDFEDEFQVHDSDLYKANIAGSEESDVSPTSGIVRMLSVYAEKCSLNGIIFIKSTKYTSVRIIWTSLLLAALGVMLYHLYRLGKNYYAYEKQSKLDLKFEKLQFPAVTFCNVNAIKFSKKHLASQELQNLIEEVDPDVMAAGVAKWEPFYENYGDDFLAIDDSAFELGEDGFRRRKRRAVSPESQADDGVKHRKNSFFDDFNFTTFDDIHVDEYSSDAFKDSWEAESESAAFDKIASQFISLYSKENTTNRAMMGHQIRNMLVQCSFSGRKCFQSNFSLVSTTTLGNCYTLEYSKFVSRKSGPRYGLSLILYLENDEYIPGITNSKGAKIVIHEANTVPFPDDEGFAISAGMEAVVGLRRVTINRLGEPWGNCTDIESFKKKYGIKYTRQTCQELCQMQQIINECDCYDSTMPSIYSLLDHHGTACQSSAELNLCMEHVHWVFNSDGCGCDSPCSEIQFRETISTKSWPNPSFARLIAKTICKEHNDLCDADDFDDVELKENFVKLTVYFETLNYQSVSEEPDYTEFQFISDIGGTVGLYVGLSVLSMCEIIHLLLAISSYLVRRIKKKM